MALEVGTRLGHYDVTALIGEGGMGQVYQATDTKLHRDVALKVLPQAFTDDPDRLARFEREATVLASLNHTNIGHIYGLEEAEGQKALVLELVEGPTLADRIKQGPISVDEALPIAKQIAEALEAAHQQGIIHRDLKPANVKVKDDGTVKVLDFGLAKAFQPDAGDLNLSQSPTISLTAAATQMGMVIGTAAYMAPEQAKGKVVDKRADVWAFGAVLYEMLTGQKPFVGDDVSDTLALVLKFEPAWDALPTDTPPRVRQLIQTCLQKEPKERVHDIADVRLAMKGAFETTASAPSEPTTTAQLQVWQRPIPAALAGLALLVMGGLTVWGLVSPAPAPAGTVTRLPFILPEGDVIGILDGMALSPDGRTLVYAGTRDGVQQLFLRPRDQMTVRPLPGTEGAVHPFFSPDGAWVGFFAAGSLKKVALVGGPAVTLCAVGGRFGATWGPDDTIVFASSDAPGLMQVSAAGGEPRPLTEPAEDARHRWPTFVPGGEAVLYTVDQPGGLDTFEVAVVSLATGAQQTLVRGTDGTVTASGHLVFGREASLWAVPFDADRLTVSGELAPMVEGVQVNTGGWAQYALASDGTLVYLPASDGGGLELVWVDRVTGEETPLAAPPRGYVHPRISPDGTRVAVDSFDQQADIWVWDLTAETLTRLTFDAARDRSPTWTPDGQRVIFGAEGGGTAELFWRAADGTGTAEPLGESELYQLPQAVAPDGSVVVVREGIAQENLVTVSLTGDPVSEDLLVTEFNESNPAFSPDGQWVAYQSDASGAFEVYVRPFPDVDAALHQISTNGGTSPLWAPDGSELFYADDGRLLAVPVQTEPAFSRGTPMVVIEGDYQLLGVPGRRYDIDPFGERFLLLKFAGEPGSDGRSLPSLTFVLDWFEELTARVPVP